MSEPPSQRPREHALATIIRGASVALLGSVLGGGLGFFFTVLMARLLDQRDFGLLVLALNILVAGSALAVAGADYATVRFVGAARDPGSKRGAMVTPLAIVTLLNVSVALVVLGLAHPIGDHVLDQPGFAGTLRAVALVLPLSVLALMFSACLSGLERASGELARKVVEQGGRVVFAPLGLWLGVGVTGAVLGMAAAAALAAVVVAGLLLRALPRGGVTRPVAAGAVVSFAWPQSIAIIAGQLWELAPVVILANASGSHTVALFGAAIAIARLPALVYNSFAYRFSPAIARLWHDGEHAELRELLKSITRWIAIFAVPLYAVAIALPAPLLHLYGAPYEDAATALAIMAAGSLLNSVTGPVEWTLIMTGRVKLEMLANVASALLLVAIALVVVPRWGLVAAAACAAGYSVALNALKTVLVWRTLGIVPLSASLAGPLAAGALAAALAAALDAATDLGSTLAGGALLSVVVLAAYALVFLRVIGISKTDRDALALAVGAAR